MWQRFTERARQVVFYAQEEAGKLGSNLVGPEHLLLGITHIPESVGALILERFGMSLDAVRTAVEARITRGTGAGWEQDMQFTAGAKKVVGLAYEEAKRLKNDYHRH